MNRAAAVLLALMMTSVTLAGCTGDDTTIQELEAAALQDQQKIEQLNSSIANSSFQIVDLQSQISALNSLIVNLNMQIFSLDENLTSEEEASESLQQQVDSLQATKEELLSEKAALEAQLANEFQMGYAQGVADASSDGSAISTLDLIHERGTLKCGVKESQWGMGYLDWETGVRSGLDIEYCRAIAAAIGLDPDTDVEYVLASGSNRFNLLSDGDIDVLIRTTTWTGSRDADLDADFAAVNFYDGQGMLIRGDMLPDDGAYSPADLDGLSVCVGTGTTSEGNLAGWAETNGVSITSVSVQDSWEAVSSLLDGECSAMTGDNSALVARKYILESDGSCGPVADSTDDDCDGLWIAPETLSKEPLAAVTRDYDSEWNEVVSWTWYGMVTAEELGVHSGNFASFADACVWGGADYNYQICRLLEESLGLGTPSNPLSDDWMKDVLAAVGNYGEAWDDAFCDGTYDGVSGSDAMTGCVLSRSGTLNALVSEGGIQYAPSWR